MKATSCRRAVVVVALLVAAQAPRPALANPGDFDDSFGDGGRMVLDFPNEEIHPTAVATQGDGKILVGGLSYPRRSDGTYNESLPRFIVVRLEADGDVDELFGDSGAARTAFDDSSAELADITVLPDGRILAAGTRGRIGLTQPEILLARYLPQGVPDPTFGDNGVTSTSVLDAFRLSAVSVQPDGNILAALGVNGYVTGENFGLARFHEDGRLDDSFGSDGVSSVPIGYGRDQAVQLATLDDGRILVGGTTDGGETKFALARFDSRGRLDRCFGLDGRTKSGVGMVADYHDRLYAASMVVQPDGRVLMGGSFVPQGREAGDFDLAVGRLNADGTPDTTFGASGGVRLDAGRNSQRVVELLLQSDGKIVAIGAEPYLTFRLTPNGSLDQSFGTNGVVSFELTDGGYARAGALDDGGNILLAGMARWATSNVLGSGSGVAKVLGDDSPARGYAAPASVRACTPPDAGFIDINADGFGDVVIGVPDEDLGGIVDAGAVAYRIHGAQFAIDQDWTASPVARRLEIVSVPRSRLGTSMATATTTSPSACPGKTSAR